MLYVKGDEQNVSKTCLATRHCAFYLANKLSVSFAFDCYVLVSFLLCDHLTIFSTLQ